MIMYDPKNHLVTDDETGKEYPFYWCDDLDEMPTEVRILLKFTKDRLTLQEAFTCLQSVWISKIKPKYLQQETYGGISVTVGADSYTELVKLLDRRKQEDYNQQINQQEETQND